MFKKLFKQEVFWGYLAQSLNIGAGLLLLPIILNELQKSEVGLWFVFITIASLGQLIEFGFQPTISRNVTYVYSGVDNLIKSGMTTISKEEITVNYKLLAALFSTSRSLYKRTTGIAAIIFFLPAALYINWLLHGNNSIALTSWILYSTGILINLFGGYYSGFLIGRGDITLSNKVLVSNKLIFIILSGITLLNGLGLIGIGISSVISSLISFKILRYYFYLKTDTVHFCNEETNSKENERIFQILWHNASRLGYVQVGAFLIQKSNILLASTVLGLATAASYGMTLSILTALSSISISIFQINLPKLNKLQINNKKNIIKVIYIEYLILSIIIFIIGVITIVFLGKSFLLLINSSTELLPNAQIFTLSLIILLELNHSISAIYLTTKNYIPFVSAALLSGICVVIFGYLIMSYLGLWALIIAQGLVQICYNNWKWPLVVFHDLYKK
jgi:O-antigen/teichoic acid export membrane protein